MKILCPTDFSEHAQIAVNYAVNLANDLDAELHFISAFDVPRKASSFISLDDVIKENTEEDMSILMNEVKPLIKTTHSPISRVFRGNPVDIILRYCKEYNIDLLVMGTQGSNSLRTLLFGSVTRKVAAKSMTPILAIPEEIANKLHENKMLITLDNREIEDESVFNVPKELAEDLNMTVDVLHIYKEDQESVPFDPIVDKVMGDLIGEIILKQGSDPVHEIKKYADEENVGMVVMLRRTKGYFENIFTVGNTSEEIARTNIPLLVLPDQLPE